MAGVRRRSRDVSHYPVLKGFEGREYVKSAVLDATSVQGGGIDEVQTITITGSPTGGTWTATFRGQTATGLAYNITPDALETALEALTSVGAGNVRVTGSAGSSYVVTFLNDLGNQDVPAMTVSGAGLTGGTSPAVAVAQTTAGSAVDAGLFVVREGTILTKVPGDTSKVRRFTAAGGEAIFGVLGMDVELFGNTASDSKDVPVFNHNCVFDKTKIPDYATHAAALAAWGAARGCVFE